MKKKRLSAVGHVFTARFPEDVWAKLRERSDASGRSYNAELVEILKEFFASDRRRPKRKAARPDG